MGVRASLELLPGDCTSCMLCVRICPVWALDLEAHPEVSEGPGRRRTSLVLEQFSIDYRTCMMCGLCIDVCPTDAIRWSPAAPPQTWAWRPGDPAAEG